MGDEHGSRHYENHGDPTKDGEWMGTTWTVSKLLLDAHTRSGKALERYMLVQYLAQEGRSDDELRQTIEQAIEDHERIIETLEMSLDEIDSGSE